MTDKRATEVAKEQNRQMAELMRAVTALKLAQRRVDDAISMCRAPTFDGYEGWSWQSIADALGVTKQAAQQRYAHRLK